MLLNTYLESKKKQFLDKLFSLHRFGIKPGLERTIKLLEHCGNPHLQFKSIHVAGTNGKGSVCSSLASILTEAGYKTGLYTSPHIERFNERIRINGKEIKDEEMLSIAENLFSVSDEIGSTFFEITTVIAFKYFAEENVDIAIIETGMGGRFDSTNVVSPALSIITQIDYDHSEYLGSTLEEIAFEKAGIIKNDTPVIVSDNHIELRKIFNSQAKEKNTEVFYSINQNPVDLIEFLPGFAMRIKNKGHIYESRLSGTHQTDNLSAVFSALEIISDDFYITHKNIADGLINIRENTGIFSRIELINAEPPLVIDVSHNVSSVQLLVDTLSRSEYADTKWNIVFGVMADKSYVEILNTLKPICKNLFAAAPAIERALGAGNLARLALENGYEKAKAFESVEEAVSQALNSGEAVLITGSFYLIGEALQVINKALK